MNKKKVGVFICIILFVFIISIVVFRKNKIDIYNYELTRSEFNFNNGNFNFDRRIFHIDDEKMIFSENPIRYQSSRQEEPRIAKLKIKFFETGNEVDLLSLENEDIEEVFFVSNNLYIEHTLSDVVKNPMAQGLGVENTISHILIDSDGSVLENNVIVYEEDTNRNDKFKMYSLNNEIYMYNKREIYEVNGVDMKKTYDFPDNYVPSHIHSSRMENTMSFGSIDNSNGNIFIYNKNGLKKFFPMIDDFGNYYQDLVKNGVYFVGEKISENTATKKYIFFMPLSNTDTFLESPIQFGVDTIFPVKDDVAIMSNYNPNYKFLFIYLTDLKNNKIITNEIKLDLGDDKNKYTDYSGCRVIFNGEKAIIYSQTNPIYFELEFK